jgi:hypothetical protein
LRGGRDSNAPTKTAGKPDKHAESSNVSIGVESETTRGSAGSAGGSGGLTSTKAEPSIADLEAEALEAWTVGDYGRARSAQAKIDARCGAKVIDLDARRAQAR